VGFGVLGLHRIELRVLATNRRAIDCYLACGFRKEGVRREAELYPDGSGRTSSSWVRCGPSTSRG
jgi:RimJ/RimL family protein N-acetyltransferase